MSTVQLGYYMTAQGGFTYHLAQTRGRGRRLRPMCGTAPYLKQTYNWAWTRQVLTVEKARERLAKQGRRACRRCDQLAEALRDPVTRLGEVTGG